MFDVRLGLNYCGFGVQVPEAELAPPMDIYPLMINCNGFYVGGTSCSRHREKFLGSSMTGFLRPHFRCFLRKEEFLNRLFYLEFDPTVLEERKIHRGQSEQNCGEATMSGLKDPKEEPAEEMTLDLENHIYTYYLCPGMGEEQLEAKVMYNVCNLV